MVLWHHTGQFKQGQNKIALTNAIENGDEHEALEIDATRTHIDGNRAREQVRATTDNANDRCITHGIAENVSLQTTDRTGA